jgi:iron complex transport system ATP-binding protein
MTTTTALIASDNLTTGYTPRSSPRAALAVVRQVTLAARGGEIVALLGPNGAGKSTVLRSLAGLLPPWAGRVTLLGQDLRDVPTSTRAKQLGVVLTDRVTAPTATAWEIAALGRNPHTGFFGTLTAKDRAVVDDSLAAVGATPLALRRFASLSDGEKQKVLIARAVAQEPLALVLDEPLSHLDIKHKIEVALILNRLASERGLAVILSLHDIDIAANYCHSVTLMRSGTVVAQGPPRTVLRGNAVDTLYGIHGTHYADLLRTVAAVLGGHA